MFGLIFIAISFMSTDTVVLTTGESIEGHFLGANEQTVQIQDRRGIVETIPREHVSTIRLAHTANSAQTPQPPPNQPPAGQRQFCALVERFQREQIAYVQETNPIRKAGMPQPETDCPVNGSTCASSANSFSHRSGPNGEAHKEALLIRRSGIFYPFEGEHLWNTILKSYRAEQGSHE